ncbi:retrovirus-related pol polyprotein from transposon TNT 1-94 [Tanacetum coccineum]
MHRECTISSTKLQPRLWSRFQFQNEVNDIPFEGFARSANPISLLGGCSNKSDNYYQDLYLKESNDHHHTSNLLPHVINWQLPDIKGHARKAKLVKDFAYHKEMLMSANSCTGVPLQAEQADWLEDTDEEIDEPELEAHYSYMAKIQEFEFEEDVDNVIPDSSNICTNDNQVDQNASECVDERAALANLIANLTLDNEENKTLYNSILFIVDSGCTKAMYWAILKLLFNFVGRNFAVTEIYMFCERSSGKRFTNCASCKLKLLPVRTERAQEFCTAIHAYFKEEGIEHQTSTPRTPEQNGVVERRNRTLVEAARTMLSASKLPLSFWAEAVGNACYTQIRIISSYPLMERRALSHSSMTGNLQ